MLSVRMGATHLQDKPDPSPRKCRMDWIILDSNITDLLEQVDPFDHFIKEIPKDHSLPAPPSISPSLIDAFLFGFFDKYLQVCDDIALVWAAKVDVTLIVVVQLSDCESPEVIAMV